MLFVQSSGIISLQNYRFEKSALLKHAINFLTFAIESAYEYTYISNHVSFNVFADNVSRSFVHLLLHLLHPGFRPVAAGFVAAIGELQPFIRRSTVLGFFPELRVRRNKFKILYREANFSTREDYRNIYQNSLVRNFASRIATQHESFARGLQDFNQLLGVFLRHAEAASNRLDNTVPRLFDPQLVLAVLDGHENCVSACSRLHHPMPSIRISMLISIIGMEGLEMDLSMVGRESRTLVDADNLQIDQEFAGELNALLNPPAN